MGVSIWILAGLLAGAPAPSGSADSAQTHQIPTQAGDQLVVRNNAGQVDVLGWHRPLVEVRYQIRDSESGAEDVEVLFWRSGSTIHLQSYFYSNHGDEAVDMVLRVPTGLGLSIWGIEPQIRLEGLHGPVRAETLRGKIEAVGLASRTSLFSRSGDIRFRSGRQPRAPIQLISRTGNVVCEFESNVDLAGTIQAGGMLSWNQQQLSKPLHFTLGSGWPRILAESDQGNVTFRYPRQLPADLDPTFLAPARQPGKAASATGAEGSAADEVLSAENPRNSTFQVNVDWVHLNVSVRDQQSRQNVINLHEEDFEVFENGLRQKIVKFESTEAPFHMLLLLDISGSTKSDLKMLKKASIGFAEQLNPADRIAVAIFNTAPYLIQAFTGDRKRVKKAIRKLSSYGGTGFYYALDFSLRRHLEGIEGRKAVVVFSDGIDDTLQGAFTQASDVTFPDLYRTVQESDSLIYIIFLDTEESYRNNFVSPGSSFLPEQIFREARIQLELLAEQSGGRLYSPLKAKDLAPVYAEIAHELRMQYTLGFISNSPRRDSSWRGLTVRLPGYPDLAPRHRKGYRLSQPDDPRPPKPKR
ncbi:MAG: VWA domain-containing protein [Acidobacteriota bacterium]